MSKKKLLVSFSGGETSAYMLYYLTHLWELRDQYEIVVVFANTGDENEETLIFVQQCAEAWGIEIVWVEAVVHHGDRIASTHKIVDFETASRKGEPFEEVVKKYGIPNQMFKHCNRELKLNPIHSFIQNDLCWSEYWTAIGIRYDEIDRIRSRADREAERLMYPLCEYKPMTKPKINFWWSQQPFRLKLKGYEGNCKVCWKKSDNKLWKLAQEAPEKFEVFQRIEDRYKLEYPESREKVYDENGNLVPQAFFRRGRYVADILEESKLKNIHVHDDASDLSYQVNIFDEEESCDIFSECGNDE